MGRKLPSLLLLGLSILFCSACYAHVIDDKPYSATNEQIIKRKLDHVKFRFLKKNAAIKKLQKHNVFFEGDINSLNISEENINSVLAAIDLLPKHLNIMFPKVMISIDPNNTRSETAFYDFHISFTQKSYGRIRLSNNWANSSFEKKVGTLLHELGHHFNYALGDFHFSDFWKNIDGRWDSINGFIKPSEPHTVVSIYGESSPSEDWAETFVSYILDKNRLIKTSYNKYQFLQQLFSEDSNKYNAQLISNIMKTYKATRKEAKNVPLYNDCRNLYESLDHKFCSVLTISLLNSKSIQNTFDSPVENFSSHAFIFYLRTLNTKIKKNISLSEAPTTYEVSE